MPFVTPADIYKARTKLTIVVKNEDSGVQNHINWFKATDLVQYTQNTTNTVLIWWAIYWVNEYVDPSITSNRLYYHFTLEPNGNLKKLQLPSGNVDSSTAFTVRVQGEDAGNIFTDKNLIKQVFIPVDSYGWLFNYELDQINSMNEYGLNPNNNQNIATFEQITLVSISAETSNSSWKPTPNSNTGSTGSTGPIGLPPITTPDQDGMCKTTIGIMGDRRQDGERARYVQPDISVASYVQVINAHDYSIDVPFYYKFSNIYSELEVYDYLYYVRPIVPTNGLDKVYVRIDPNGNANAARSSATFDPKSYPTISWGNKAFNIFTIGQSSEWYFDNLYIPTTFYGALFTEEYDYFSANNCFQTFETITYQDISDIGTSKDFSNNQTQTDPPIVVDPTDPVVTPPVDTTDPDDPNNIPPVDTTDPDDYGQNDTDDNTVIVDDNGNVVGETSTVETEDAGNDTVKPIKLGYSLRGKGGPIKTEIKNDTMNMVVPLGVLILIIGYALYDSE